MAEDLEAFVSDEFLQGFEQKYNEEQLCGGAPSLETTFQYAWCLVRSRVKSDVNKGIGLLEGLMKRGESLETRRDYLYYLAVGHARNKNYNEGLKWLKVLLQMEPGNKQAQALEKHIRSSMDSDALKGAAIAGAGLMAVGALIGIGFGLLKKH